MTNTHNILAEVVGRVRCKPGWSLRLVTPTGDVFPKLVVTVPGYDSAGASSRRADYAGWIHAGAIRMNAYEE